MHRKLWIISLELLFFSLCLTLNATATAQSQRPRIDTFLFLYDATSSMDEKYQKGRLKKAALAIEAMKDINKDIPHFDYQSGLFVVTPSFDLYQNILPYDSASFEFAIDQLPLPSRHIGPQTPLAEGLTQLDQILNQLSGSTAVILFSDSGANKGDSPVKVLQDLYKKYDVCVHFVSYAQQEEEKEIIRKMRQLSDCSEFIMGEAVQDDQARAEFVRNIFYRTLKDSDGDGVPDSRDLCPDTPPGVEVDEDGCPVDSDGDGVPDYLDNCPDTPHDLVVDQFGCPVPKRISLDIKFDFDRAVIKPKYHDELKKVADFMKQHPGINGIIEGHTDSRGMDAYNQELSKRRAASVEAYLVRNLNISADRLSAVGYGESRPIATNDTAAGRQKNRRVEGVFPKVFQKRR